MYEPQRQAGFYENIDNSRDGYTIIINTIFISSLILPTNLFLDLHDSREHAILREGDRWRQIPPPSLSPSPSQFSLHELGTCTQGPNMPANQPVCLPNQIILNACKSLEEESFGMQCNCR